MGSSVKKVGEGQYNIWSTVSDSYWFEAPVSKLEAFEAWEASLQRKARMQLVEDIMSFDDRKKGSYASEAAMKGTRDYHEWALTLYRRGDKEEGFDMGRAIEDKIAELKKAMSS